MSESVCSSILLSGVSYIGIMQAKTTRSCGYHYTVVIAMHKTLAISLSRNVYVELVRLHGKPLGAKRWPFFGPSVVIRVRAVALDMSVL